LNFVAQRQKIQTLEEENENKDQRISELLNVIEQQKLQIESLETKLREQTKHVIAKYEELIEMSKSQIQTLALKDKVIEDLNEKNLILSKQLEDTQRVYNDEIAQLKSRLIKIQNQYIALHNEFDLARKIYEDRIVSLEKELQESQQRNEIERNEQQLPNKFIEREKFEELLTECRMLHSKCNELMNLNSVAVNENQNLISQVTLLKQELAILNDQNTKLRSELLQIKQQQQQQQQINEEHLQSTFLY
jgi:chromosome segregation ATPase